MSEVPDIGTVAVQLLGLEPDPRGNPSSGSFNVKCPFCDVAGSRKYHMNINTVKNVYWCPRCMTNGAYQTTGTLDLYGRLRFNEPLRPGVNGKKLYHQLMLELDGSCSTSTRKSEQTYQAVEEIKPPSDKVLDKTFRALLALPELALSEAHKQNLIKRGMSEAAIVSGGYRTFPPATEFCAAKDPRKKMRRIVKDAGIDRLCAEDPKLKSTPKFRIYAGMIIAHELLNQGVTIKNVPGFFQLTDKYWCFKYEEGMFIPTKNVYGEIVGAQTRLENAKKSGLRYMTLSSKGFKYGPNANISRAHFTSSKEVSKATTVMVTEGPLKGNTILDLYLRTNPDADIAVIAIQGVNNTKELPVLIKYLTSKGVERFYNMLDMDKYVNQHVKKASDAINEIFRNNGADIQEALWDAQFARWESKRMAAVCKALGNNVALTKNPYADLTGMTNFLGSRANAENLKALYEQYKGTEKESILNMVDEEGSYKGFWRPETKGYDDYLKYNLEKSAG